MEMLGHEKLGGVSNLRFVARAASFFQVCDLSEEAPDKVLHRLYTNLERLKIEGDILAVQIWRTLRLIVSDSTFIL
jgi:hypothetical protein